MKILYICFGCGVMVSAPDTECENCGTKKDEDDRGWITASVQDDDADRLSHTEMGAGLMLDREL